MDFRDLNNEFPGCIKVGEFLASLSRRAFDHGANIIDFEYCG